MTPFLIASMATLTPKLICCLGVRVTTETVVNKSLHQRKGTIAMTATLDTSNTTGMNLSAAGMVNARTEAIYLKTADYQLTARQVVYCLAAHLANYGDNFDPRDVDAPLWAIDVHMRFDGDLQGWARGRTPNQVALVLARAEQIAVGYFGHRFPALPW